MLYNLFLDVGDTATIVFGVGAGLCYAAMIAVSLQQMMSLRGVSSVNMSAGVFILIALGCSIRVSSMVVVFVGVGNSLEYMQRDAVYNTIIEVGFLPFLWATLLFVCHLLTAIISLDVHLGSTGSKYSRWLTRTRVHRGYVLACIAVGVGNLVFFALALGGPQDNIPLIENAIRSQLIFHVVVCVMMVLLQAAVGYYFRRRLERGWHTAAMRSLVRRLLVAAVACTSCFLARAIIWSVIAADMIAIPFVGFIVGVTLLDLIPSATLIFALRERRSGDAAAAASSSHNHNHPSGGNNNNGSISGFQQQQQQQQRPATRWSVLSPLRASNLAAAFPQVAPSSYDYLRHSGTNISTSNYNNHSGGGGGGGSAENRYSSAHGGNAENSITSSSRANTTTTTSCHNAVGGGEDGSSSNPNRGGGGGGAGAGGLVLSSSSYSSGGVEGGGGLRSSYSGAVSRDTNTVCDILTGGATPSGSALTSLLLGSAHPIPATRRSRHSNHGFTDDELSTDQSSWQSEDSRSLLGGGGAGYMLTDPQLPNHGDQL